VVGIALISTGSAARKNDGAARPLRIATRVNLLRPGGETKCAKDGEYAFSVRPGAKDKLLVWFEGGGACWRGKECLREQFYRAQPDSAVTGPRDQGIFDQADPANPFTEYSTVIVRYCTGDIHLGDRDATYTLRDDTGESRKVTIHHRGQANAMTVLRWVHENFPAPRDIFVSGTSGGAYPTPFYASLLARHYPTGTRGGARGLRARYVARTPQLRVGIARHGTASSRMGTVPRKLARIGLVHHGRAVPRLRLMQFNHAYDAEMRFRLRQLGGMDGGRADLLTLLRAEHRDIKLLTAPLPASKGTLAPPDFSGSLYPPSMRKG
jgi:Pectinacetylesterase